MDFNFKDVSAESLQRFDSENLIQMVLFLHDANDKLKKSTEEETEKNYDTKLEQLEKEMNKLKQYVRRDTVEISGIGMEVADINIEDECLKIFKAVKVKVSNRFPTNLDIQAAHRKDKKGTVICKFVNRKFALTSLAMSSNLKDLDGYNGIYINPSLCPEFGFLGFAVRRAKKNGEIFKYRNKNGIMFVQKTEDCPWSEITHENDLKKLRVSIPERSF